MARLVVVLAGVLSLLVTWGLGFVLIPWLAKIKFGQTINEIGPKWHKQKQGTPTMGGLLFIAGSSVGVLAAYPVLYNFVPELSKELGLLLLAVFTTMAFSAVGFLDDYLKVVHKQNLGLHAKSKLVMQSLITACFLVSLHLMGRLSTFITLPLVGIFNLGFLFYPIAFVMIIGVVNAANLTDGIDGLATSVTLCVMCGYVFVLTLLDRFSLSLWAGALVGGCAGFLLWNFYPAKVFMGDTGSMFLGGAVATLGFCMGTPELVIIFSLVYIVEAVSVMIQVGYFKLTKGKRLFKMTPIHHHFELLGWSEIKIVVVFSLAAIACVLMGCLYLYFVL